jgi:hypothetical protein
MVSAPLQRAEEWASSSGVETTPLGLEVYGLGAEESDLKLPVPSSIQPFVPDET